MGIFYSSCIVRETKVTFLELPGASFTPTAPRWKFNGRCLSCDTFEAAKAPFDQATININKFVISEKCEDCDGIWSRVNPVKVVNRTQAPAPLPPKGGTFAPTAIPTESPTDLPTAPAPLPPKGGTFAPTA